MPRILGIQSVVLVKSNAGDVQVIHIWFDDSDFTSEMVAINPNHCANCVKTKRRKINCNFFFFPAGHSMSIDERE